MVLNALHLPAPTSPELAPFNAFDQTNIFNQKTESAVPQAVIEKHGMTLDQLGAFVQALGLNVDVHHASDSSLDDFRRQAVEYLGTTDNMCSLIFSAPPSAKTNTAIYLPLPPMTRKAIGF